MIYLYTDFGYEGPYVGQMKAVLARLAPEVPVIDIMHDAPVCDPKRATYLLAALAQKSEFGDVWLCVVDPGVGSERLPVILDCGGVTFVGPNNGLFELIHRRVNGATLGQIAWQPDIMSATFHGRDLFAPVAAWTAIGEDVETAVIDPAEPRPGVDWPDDLAEIIYIDAYGNLVTGIGGSALTDDQEIAGAGRTMKYARTFSDVPEGKLFWHRNSMGLIEIAANRACANQALDLQVGDSIKIF